MKKGIFSFLVFALLFSCNNEQNPAKQPNQMENDSIAARVLTGSLLGEFCYSYTNKKDSVLLHANIGDSAVTGNLYYNFYEKDKNNGTITGKIKGDTLLADYTFISEGKQSVREVAFLLTDSTAKEGYGEMIEKNNKMVFANPKNVSFNNSFILIKENCN
jgi:hypothetical protein